MIPSSCSSSLQLPSLHICALRVVDVSINLQGMGVPDYLARDSMGNRLWCATQPPPTPEWLRAISCYEDKKGW